MEEAKTNQILEDIQQTGFVTELKVGSLLRKNNWFTDHASTYKDLDLEKSREIDIIATKVKHDIDTDFHFELNLIIEVKKMTKYPWIIFTNKRELYFPVMGWSILHKGRNYNIEIEDESEANFVSTIFSSNNIEKDNFRNKLKGCGIAFHEAFKQNNKGDTSKIFDALITVSKAAWYQNNKHKWLDDEYNFNPENPTELHINIPVVILEGELFSASLDEKGEILLAQEKLIQTQLNYSSPKYGEHGQTFLPDIVEITYLEEYLKKSDIWFDSMFEKFNEEVTRLRKKTSPK